MKVLVTGGAGFIGSHLAAKLVQQKHEVTILDNLHTGNKKNIESFLDKIKFYNASCSEIAKLGINGMSVIFHYGVASSTPMYKENVHLVSSAISEFISILEYARKNNSRIILSSSSSLYNGLTEPFREKSTIPVTDFYTEARFSMERLLELYNKLYGVKTISLRNFSIYGPNELYKRKYANVISQFLWALLKKERPVIYGDGSQTRDFIYIDDAIEAAIQAMHYEKKGFDIFNVGTGKNATFNEVFTILKHKLESDVEPVYVKNEIKNYVYNTRADTKKAEKELNFKAKIGLEEGIGRLIDYYAASNFL